MSDFNDFVDKKDLEDLLIKENKSPLDSNVLFNSISDKIDTINFAPTPKITKEDVESLLPVHEPVKESLEDDHEEITKEMIAGLIRGDQPPIEDEDVPDPIEEKVKPQTTFEERSNSIIDVLTSNKPITKEDPIEDAIIRKVIENYPVHRALFGGSGGLGSAQTAEMIKNDAHNSLFSTLNSGLSALTLNDAIIEVLNTTNTLSADVYEYIANLTDADITCTASGMDQPTPTVKRALEYIHDELEIVTLSAGAVASVFGRAGVIYATSGDYNSNLITHNGSSVSASLISLSANFDNYYTKTQSDTISASLYQMLSADNNSWPGVSADYYTSAQVDSKLTNYSLTTHSHSYSAHDALTNLNTSNYQHLTSAQYNTLTSGGNAQSLHKHREAVTIVTADYTITTANDHIVGNSTSAIGMSLPAATGSAITYRISNINSGNITVSGNLIDGETTKIVHNKSSMLVQDIMSNYWKII